MSPSQSLRPRSLLEIYDAAFDVAASSSRVAALAFLGAAPVAVLGVVLTYVSAEGVVDDGGQMFLVLACSLATMLRFVPGGAVSRVVLDQMAGRDTTALEALRQAAGKAPALMAAGSLSLLVALLSLPLLMMPALFAGGTWLGAPMVMQDDKAPWRLIRESRRLMGERTAVLGVLTLLWALGVCLLALNIGLLLALVLMIARGLANLELGFISALLSTANPVFVPALLGLAFVLLEPVRQASIAIVHADAKARREGTDLAVELESISSEAGRRRSGAKSSGIVALLCLLVAAPGPALAERSSGGDHGVFEGEPVAVPFSPEEEAEALRRDLSELIRYADGASFERVEGLDRLAGRIETEIDEGRLEVARKRLEGAKREIRPEEIAGTRHREAARRAAREVLSRSEFRRFEREAGATTDLPKLSLLDRFFRWLERHLTPRHSHDTTSEIGEGLGELAMRLLWVFFLLLLAVFSIVFVIRALRARASRSSEEAADADDGTDGEDAPGRGALGLDPLSRSPEEWLEHADRLSSAGEHREALRAAYLALLARLHRARVIDYRPWKSNWEHAREYRGAREHEEGLARLTRAFERTWYGRRVIGSEEYEAAREDTLLLLDSHRPSSSQVGDHG